MGAALHTWAAGVNRHNVLAKNFDLQRKWISLRATPWFPAVLLIVVQLTSGMRDSTQGPFFLIYLQEQLGLTAAAISGVVAGAQVAGMVAALLGGAIAARLGSKWVLACGLALAGLSSLVFQAHALWLAAALWWIGGAGMALATVGGASYLTRLSDRGALGILAALYVMSSTAGGAVGNPIAGVLIERSGYGTFGGAVMALTALAVLVVIFLMANLRDRATQAAPLRAFWSNALSATRSRKGRLVIGMRSLPTIFYGMLVVLIPLLLNTLSGSKVMVAAYGTATLVVASIAQLLAGRAADRWGARRPTLIAYSIIILAGLGLAASAGTVWGLFAFGVIGVAAAWSLSALMYVWVGDGIPKPEHPATFGLLHAVWSLSMITGSVLGGWFVPAAPGLAFLIAGLLNAGSLLLTLVYYRAID
jgi:MFS family permease